MVLSELQKDLKKKNGQLVMDNQTKNQETVKKTKKNNLFINMIHLTFIRIKTPNIWKAPKPVYVLASTKGIECRSCSDS